MAMTRCMDQPGSIDTRSIRISPIQTPITAETANEAAQIAGLDPVPPVRREPEALTSSDLIAVVFGRRTRCGVDHDYVGLDVSGQQIAHGWGRTRTALQWFLSLATPCVWRPPTTATSIANQAS